MIFFNFASLFIRRLIPVNSAIYYTIVRRHYAEKRGIALALTSYTVPQKGGEKREREKEGEGKRDEKERERASIALTDVSAVLS